MEINDKVTVAIPCYNAEKFIIDAIKSILDQTYRVDEILLCDNDSEDKSVAKVKSFIKKGGYIHIKLIVNEKNIGNQRNTNKCLKTAKNRYVGLLHADDMLKPDTVEKQIKMLKNHPDIALVGGQEDLVDKDGNMIKEKKPIDDIIYKRGEVYEFITKQNLYIPSSTVMYDMEKINKIGYYKEIIFGEDELHWPRVLTKYPIAVLGESLIYRRIHPGQMEWDWALNKPKEIVDVYKNLLRIENYDSRIVFRKKIKRFIKKYYSNTLLSIAASVIRHHQNTKIAFYYLGQSRKINPFVPIKTIIFWKVLFMIMMNKIGLLNTLRKIKYSLK